MAVAQDGFLFSCLVETKFSFLQIGVSAWVVGEDIKVQHWFSADFHDDTFSSKEFGKTSRGEQLREEKYCPDS